ncbi:MAG TPA: glycoside hydrolase family 38 C-terminal domain-containing protein [Gemmatimonadaceae bacterium]|nr:glycoside hydrolase family 38 C-terminal domain-containing protein [Gemmatimonadaceae bacterium]
MTIRVPLELHVVSHTHWDREWYQPAGRFRQRLVALVDELLDDPPAGESSFLLDGQAVVVEDYLAVRSERRDALAALLRAGRLEAGPWYVLADELIPSGEALVRNLLAGRRVIRALGAEPPPVLYCPDSFGHPAALPALARGFGLDVVIVWRGYGGARWPVGDSVRWRAPNGDEALLYHLPPDGYEFGSSLPVVSSAAALRWKRIRDVLAPRATTGVALLTHGADHHARQRDESRALDLLRDSARPDADVRTTSLARFAERLRDAARTASLPTVEGELRDSYGYTWTLQGTFATRAVQKRRNARAERLLLREAEPWSALAQGRGGADRSALLRAAWRSLLECHPHDSLCGCSIDVVARAVDVRLSDAIVQARGLRDDALLDLIGHDSVAARERRGEWTPVVVVRNSAPRPRRGVAEVRIATFVRDVPVGPGSARIGREMLTAARAERDALHREQLVLRDGDRPLVVQPISSALATELVESPRHYPDADRVVVSRALAWVNELGGYGTRALRITPADHPPGAVLPHDVVPVTAGSGFLDNGLLRVEWDARGALSLADRDGRRTDRWIVLENRSDRGDLYTPSLRDEPRIVALTSPRLAARGPLRASVAFDAQLPGVANARVVVSLDADAPFARIVVRGENLARDHRLRIVFATDIARGDSWADAAFGPVPRVPLATTAHDRIAETPPPTAPLHRYVSLFDGARGATLFSDGLAEYETTADGHIAVTLLRAVGELSRDDLPERPGHAAWPAPTPMAQSIGPFVACFALALHGPRDSATIDAVERMADDVLLPLRGATLRSALGVPSPVSALELEGAGLAFSACKPAEREGWIVLRCVNALDTSVSGRWRLGWDASEAARSRLDEEPLAGIPIRDRTIEFTAAPREIVTILAR